MNKVVYWLKKIGVLRSGFYTAKGKADKVVEMNIKGELYQSDQEIEREYEQKNNEKVPHKKDDKNTVGKITFWVFVVVGIFFLLAFFGGEWSFWKLISVVLWIGFLVWLWKHATAGMFAIGKILVVGIGVIFISLIAVTPSEESQKISENNADMKNVEQDHNESAYIENGVENDFVVKFLRELESGTAMNFSKIQNDDIVWTGGPGLQLQKAKSYTVENVSQKDIEKIKNYFAEIGSNDGGIGFRFASPVGVESYGFALTNQTYTGMMCIMRVVEENAIVGCGWGPTNNPNKDK